MLATWDLGIMREPKDFGLDDINKMMGVDLLPAATLGAVGLGEGNTLCPSVRPSVHAV